MKLWLDAQLPPQLAIWIQQTFAINASARRDLGLRDATDNAIFEAARQSDPVLISKDSDFVELVLRHGAAPKSIWLTCGNVSNAALQMLLGARLGAAIELLDRGETIVELA